MSQRFVSALAAGLSAALAVLGSPLAATLPWSHTAVLSAQSAPLTATAVAVAQLMPTARPPALPGESASLDTLRALRGASLTVSYITYGPSDVYFERFGHGALAFRDSITGEDVAYNWGMFDFDEPGFLKRFLTGDTKYWMAGYPTPWFNNIYRTDNRSIREQVLAFTPVERAALLEFVQWMSREENKYYRYDYYRDNCATRIRDAIDRVLHGRLHTALDTPGEGRTWRNETARLLASMLPLYMGIELALGRHADEPLSKWDEEFLPEHMASHYATLMVFDAGGQPRPLVAHDTMLFVSTRPPLPTKAPSYIAMSFLIGLTLAGLIASISDARTKAAHRALSVGVALWYGIGGLLGTALLLAGTVTKHAPYMGANTSLFAVQPLLLVAAFIVPLALMRERRTSSALGISMLIAILSFIGIALQLVPGWAQGSSVIFAMVVPVHISIAIAVWRLDHHAGMPSA